MTEHRVAGWLQPPAFGNDVEPEFVTDGSWERVDLGPALRGEVTRAIPDTLCRENDGLGLFYPGAVNGLHGDAGDGKTMAAWVTAAALLSDEFDVLYVDFEGNEAEVVDRLVDTLRIPAEVVAEHLIYFRPTEPFHDLALDTLAAVVRERRPRVVVIDSVGEAFALEGTDGNLDREVGPWMRRVARRIANLGPAVVLIDHGTKSKEQPLFPAGSIRKLAAITGAQHWLTAPVPLTRERGGRLKFTCAKDRHGHYRRGEVAAVIYFDVYPDGGMTVHVRAPEPDADPGDHLLALAGMVVGVVRDAGGPITQREIMGRIARPGPSDARVRGAIDFAERVGALRITEGPRRARLHHYVRDIDPERDQ